MAKAVFLDFEKDLGEIHKQIEELENKELETGESQSEEIAKLNRKMRSRTAEIYADLTPWQTQLVSRHPNRPYTLDYIDAIFEDFHELHGDRTFADDQSIVGGLARLGEHAVMVIGHQKGRDTRERTRRNFGMTRPEGYRKALRLMKLAEKFGLPVFTFVDTPGAYPGIDAEERNQSEAIGRNIYELTKLRVPVISTIIGEGGSGGALAIAVCDALLMLQYSTYSVISPEGCASILWKSADKAPQAAQALALTSGRLYELGLVDKVISEPLGGAHRDPKLMASTLRKALVDQLKTFLTMNIDDLLERRLARLLSYGRFEEECSSAVELLCSDYMQKIEAEHQAEQKKEVCALRKPSPRKKAAVKAKTAEEPAQPEAVPQAAVAEPAVSVDEPAVEAKSEEAAAAEEPQETVKKPVRRRTTAKKSQEAATAKKPAAKSTRSTAAKKTAAGAARTRKKAAPKAEAAAEAPAAEAAGVDVKA